MFLGFLLRYFRDPRLERGTATFSTPAKPAPETQVIQLGYFPDPERTSFAPERWSTAYRRAGQRKAVSRHLWTIDRLKLETMQVAHPKLNGITLGDGPLPPLAIECKELQSKLYQQAYILFQLLKAWDDEEDTDSKVRQAYKTRQWAEHSFAAFCARYELMPEGEIKSLLLEIAYSAEKQHR